MLFIKMHGLGNNYVLFNQLDQPKNILSEEQYGELSQKVSDVHFGIGSDGIILIADSKAADFKMRIFNKDGSEGKNCGNGLRCVAKYLYDHQYAKTTHFSIETLAGVVDVEVEVAPEEKVEYVRVDMGVPKLLKGLIPMKGEAAVYAIDEPYTFNGKTYKITSVSMGNPHAIMFVDDLTDLDLTEVGPKIEHDPLYPERVNVGVVQIENRVEIHYKVWERGSGITMACGTGACASVVAATLNGLLDKNKEILVHLPGGDLTIEWGEKGHIWMRGNATYVCHGKLDLFKTEINTLS